MQRILALSVFIGLACALPLRAEEGGVPGGRTAGGKAPAKGDKEGWDTLPEGASLTLYMSHDGASLTVNRIQAIRVEGELILARSQKKDLLFLARTDLFAVGVEGTAAGPVRKTGFG